MTRNEVVTLRRLMWGPRPARANHPTLCDLNHRGFVIAGAKTGDDRTWALTAAAIDALGVAGEPDLAIEQAVVDLLNHALGHPPCAIESQAA